MRLFTLKMAYGFACLAESVIYLVTGSLVSTGWGLSMARKVAVARMKEV